MVIVLSATEHPGLYNTRKTPNQRSCSCDCFLKVGMWASCDVLSRPALELSILMQPPHKRTRKYSFSTLSSIQSRRRRPQAVVWSHLVKSWLSLSLPIRDRHKRLKCLRIDSSTPKEILQNDRLSCKAINTVSRKFPDCGDTLPGDYQFTEEPWLLQSLSRASFSFTDSNSSDIHLPSESGTTRCLEREHVEFLSDSPHEEQCSTTTGDAVSLENDFEAFLVEYSPVEEPWLLQSSAKPSDTDIEAATDIPCPEDSLEQKETLSNSHHEEEVVLEQEEEEEVHEQEEEEEEVHGQEEEEEEVHEQEKEEEKEKDEVEQFLIDDEHVTSTDDLVSTKILINSSVCTMQRIAVLEDGKLVELLLEPVKNNVQCDSVYLGLVTKMVPHMGGAFVNIGGPRASLMDIKPRREPFIFPPFRKKETQVSFGDIAGASDTRTISDEIEETDFEEEGENDEDSEEFMGDDELGEKGTGENSDILKVLKSSNGSVATGAFDVNWDGHLEKLSGAPVVNHKSQNGLASQHDTIWSKVQRGTKVLVQVVKEGLGAKAPLLTAYPKLRSRFWVLMTCCSTIGISKKISGVERTRLKIIAASLQPPGFGLTVRTVAAGHSMEELRKDLEKLLYTWKGIIDHAQSAALAADEGVNGAVPVILHQAMKQTLSVVQDYFNDRVESMIVDSPRTFHEITNYLQEMAPNLCNRVELYSKRTPLFDEYKLEDEINSILVKRVPLDNGGYLVIEQTEALVSIDVNGGQCMLGQGTSQEKAILDVNLAAAKQIARELRLRDIGGIIVVDFIDMHDDSNKRLVYEEVKKAVGRDRSMVKISELSKHGLMEITRKRVRPSVSFMISEPCTCCSGTGRVEALETSFSKIEREICRLLSTMDLEKGLEKPKSWPKFALRVDQHMCNYLTSGKRTKLAILSSSLKVWILIKVVRGFPWGGFELKPLVDDREFNRQHPESNFQPMSKIKGLNSRPTKKVTLFPIKKWKTGRE